MDFEYIKVGETYLLPVTVTAPDIEKRDWLAIETANGYGYMLAPSDVRTLLQNSIKNTENAPKYDPRHPFREGDKVRPIERNGRIFSLYWKDKIGKLLTVTKSESFDYVELPEVDGQPIDPAYLELVTPVDAIELYSVRESDAFDIVREGKIVMTIPFTEDDYYTFEQAKAAAKAECDRLNAEWQNSQNN